MAASLRPDSHWPALCRGLAYLEQRSYREALAAFDEVIRLRPDVLATYFDRALASYHLGDLAARRRFDASSGRAEARRFAPISCEPESGRSKATARAPAAIGKRACAANRATNATGRREAWNDNRATRRRPWPTTRAPSSLTHAI